MNIHSHIPQKCINFAPKFYHNLKIDPYIFTTMKTKKQILAFLQTNHFQTAADLELVSLYCQQHCNITPKEVPEYTVPGDVHLSVTSQMFIEWLNNGFGCDDMVKDEAGNLYMISSSSIHNITTIATKKSGVWKTDIDEILNFTPTHISESEFLEEVIALGRNGLEYDYETSRMRNKYIPGPNERVEFFQGDKRGLGVVRDVDIESGEIEFYCYFMYSDKSMGYSMHERNVCDLYSFQFNPMTIVAQRRMNREFNKAGKVWNDKLHRIEPVEPKVAKGEKYWYISDKLKIVQDKEKDTPTSHFRYIAGNYFTDFDEALEYLGRISELMRDRLAK